MNTIEQQKAAKCFAEFWHGKGYEKGESQTFWLTLLNQVFGIEHPEKFITFEQQVHLDHTSFVDAFIPSTKVMIEQKSLGKDLGSPIKQSDGSLLNPFQQAKRYAAELPYSQRPRWIVTCNFYEFWVYDMEQPNSEPQKILLCDLEKEYERLLFLTDTGNDHIKREMQISVEAGGLVAKIYDELQKQYLDPNKHETLRSLNILCVRLVFCLYAEDAHLFGKKTAFHDYLAQYQAKDIRRALIDLFTVLDTPIEERDPYLDSILNAFPYVNGGLFSRDTRLEIPQFTDELKELILSKASDDFDWSEISPTIFGAVFESTLNPETRRSGGMHYTSIENIHKVIDPLFFDALREEFDTIKQITQEKQRLKKLDAFQEKLASLTFLDPACGSGNFLTESYVSLRRLENNVIALKNKGQIVIGEFANPIKVDIHQFYGIEINDFAVSVATTALWIAEQQMLQETAKLVHFNVEPLPLKAYHNIKEGNALRTSWTEWDVHDDDTTVIIADRANVYIDNTPLLPEVDEPVVKYGNIDLYSKELSVHAGAKEKLTRHVEFDYIISNPPFVGARLMSEEQKDDVIHVFGPKWKNVGNMDYVCCWYKRAAEVMTLCNKTRTALVSTNSVSQGEQVAILWKPLMQNMGIQIDFAYRTFRWDSESESKAHVHCVIISFSKTSVSNTKLIFTNGGKPQFVKQINPYIIDAPTAFIESRNHPLNDIPEIGIGNKPIDGGNYLFTEEEMLAFIKKEPASKPYFKKWIGADEFINRRYRYCLWLGDCSPAQLRSMPECLKRVTAVRNFRLASKSEGTRRLADRPTRFHVENMPSSNYIVIPETSSERRRYVPMGFMTPDVLCSNAIRLMPTATLFHFGILTSNVHMAWMRVVCGRLKSDYRYSKDIVYNNFPWPTPTEEQRKSIECTAQAILDARALYKDSSLADLYDEVTMPVELRKAHQANDRAVMAAYGFSTKMTESECVAHLFEMYQELTEKES